MLVRRCLSAFEVARSDQHGEAVGREVLGDLEADALVGSGDERDGAVVHGDLLLTDNLSGTSIASDG